PTPEPQTGRGAVATPAWPARVRRNDAADGSSGAAGWIEGQPLPVRRQPRGERAGRDPGLHRDGEVVRVVLDRLIQPGEIEHEVEVPRRMTELERAPRAARHHGESTVR